MDSIIALLEKVDWSSLWTKIEAVTGKLTVDQVITALKSVYTFVAGLFSGSLSIVGVNPK